MNNLLRRITLLAICGGTMALLAAPGRAASKERGQGKVQTTNQRMEAQEERIQSLEKRLKDLESAAMAGKSSPPESVATSSATPALSSSTLTIGEFREPHFAVSNDQLASKDFPGSWPMFGSDFRMKIGGYFKLDALYDFDGTGNTNQFLMSQIPVSGSPEDGRSGYFNMLVRETRFNFDARKSTPDEFNQQVFIEMDYFDETNNSPRLRHAYVKYGNLIVGQTWNALAETRALNYMIDFAYGDAIFGTRSVQARWVQPVNKNWWWTAGVEKIGDSAINSQGAAGVASPRFPLLAGRVTHETDSSIATIGGMVNELRWDGEGVGPNAHKAAWAVVAAGREYFTPRRHYAVWNLAYGNGAGGNTAALAGSNTNATLLADGSLETNKHYNVSLGYTHNLAEKLTTNLNYAWLLVQKNSRAPDAIRGGHIGHVNLMWKVTQATLTGIEYMWGYRENINGANGNASRVQTTIQYYF